MSDTVNEMSKERLQLYQKIAELKADILPLIKDQDNPFHKSKYFDINSILEHVDPLMAKRRLLLTQPIINGYVVSRITDLDTGETDESSLQIPVSPDPQKIGSCITYFRRYTVQSQIGLRSEDDDANKGSGKGERPPANNGQQSPPAKPWLNEKDKPAWDKVVKALKGGKTMLDIRTKWSVSKSDETKLWDQVKLIA